MRAFALLLLLFFLSLVCVAARGEDEEPIPVRVLCEGGRLAALQLYVEKPGVITLRIPANVCGVST